jgi:hypothetical protein
MGRTHRSVAARRNVGRREPRKRVVVICEGEKTEPTYLRLLNIRTREALIELEIVDEPATNPKKLVERACSLNRAAAKEQRRTKDPNARIDEIWCVFDVDEHVLLREACQQALDNRVRLAVSNPSIEVWFLLHFQDQWAHIHRHEALRVLRDHLPRYDKGFVDVEDLLGRFDAARSRAQRLDVKHQGDGTQFPDNNPSSDLWKLVQSLKAEY